jgi:hypothetical protein
VVDMAVDYSAFLCLSTARTTKSRWLAVLSTWLMMHPVAPNLTPAEQHMNEVAKNYFGVGGANHAADIPAAKLPPPTYLKVDAWASGLRASTIPQKEAQQVQSSWMPKHPHVRRQDPLYADWAHKHGNDAWGGSSMMEPTNYDDPCLRVHYGGLVPCPYYKTTVRQCDFGTKNTSGFKFSYAACRCINPALPPLQTCLSPKQQDDLDWSTHRVCYDSPIHTHPHSSTLIHTHPHSFTLIHTHPHSSTLTHTHPHSSTLTHTHPHSSTLIHTHPHSSTLTHTHPHSSTLTHTHPHSSTLIQAMLLHTRTCVKFRPHRHPRYTHPHTHHTYSHTVPVKCRIHAARSFDHTCV